VDQSYLTQLWNKEAFKKHETGLDTLINNISKYFTFIILGIAVVAGTYWYFIDLEKMFQVVSAILIIACPCALALSSPFTFGHIMRILGRNKFYVKDTLTIEKIAKVDTLVFDKTGTITHRKKSNLKYEGSDIQEFDLLNIKSLVKNSNHPLSKSLYEFLNVPDEYYPVENFEEISGKGYEAYIRGNLYKIGSAKYNNQESKNLETAVYISKNNQFLGKYIFKNEYRDNLKNLFTKLTQYKIYILSGDNSSEENQLKEIIPNCSSMAFNQSPEDKLNYIQNLQDQGSKVIMLGDGLNDSNSFTPSSDVIMNGEKVTQLNHYLDVCKGSITIVKLTFVISFLYNIVGLSFAVTGNMSPLFAAIIMPISSITVITFTTVSTWILGRKHFKKAA